MLAQGKIDAAWAPEPWGSRLIVEAGGKLIAEEKDNWPDKQFTLTLVVTTPKFLKEHPDVVAKVLKVHTQWTQRLNADPQKYQSQLGDALAALTGKKLPAGVVEQALPRVKFTDEPLENTLTTMAQWSYDLHVINQPPKSGWIGRHDDSEAGSARQMMSLLTLDKPIALDYRAPARQTPATGGTLGDELTSPSDSTARACR